MSDDGIVFGDFPSNVHYQEHRARYEFAGRHVTGKRVLDLGSGARDGSCILAGSADTVFSADYVPAQVRAARDRFPADNLAHFATDALAIGCGDATFEAVVTLEVIEHFAEHERFLVELTRILRSDGTLVISTPNRGRYEREGRTRSEDHVQELTCQEFQALLGRHFREVTMYGVRRGRAVVGLGKALHRFVRAVDVFNLRRFVSPAARAGVYTSVATRTGRRPDHEIEASDIEITPEDPESAPFVAAVCRGPVRRA